MAKTFGTFVLLTLLGHCFLGLAAAQLPGAVDLPVVEPVDPDTLETLPEGPAAPREPRPSSPPADTARLDLSDSIEPELALEPHASHYEMWDLKPAILESSGTWLRRGFWYTEIDAVIFNRFWQRNETIFAIDSAGGFLGPQDTFRTLELEGTKPGTEGNARFTLGRFLFRDMKNRDHSAEFTAFGGGDYFQECFTEARFPNAQRLNVPVNIDNNNLSFDGAASSDIAYASRFNSFEANYVVRSRMDRDRMIMDPTGEWVRQASPSLTREFLVGLRYFDLKENVNWRAFDFFQAPGSTGSYVIDTDNRLFGPQIGTAFRFEKDRWSIGLSTKAGVYLNDLETRSRFTRSDIPEANFDLHDSETPFSFISQTSIIAKWHLRPNLSIRAGWEFLYVTSVALAPNQINFRPDDLKAVYTGDPFYNGAVFGFEGYW